MVNLINFGLVFAANPILIMIDWGQIQDIHEFLGGHMAMAGMD